MSFAAIADVEALLRRHVTTDEVPFVTRLLTMADGAITNELPGVAFDGVVTGATATFPRIIDDEIWLPGRPVVQVTQVTMDGDVVDADHYVVSRWGPLRRRHVIWPDWSDIVVTWDYGFVSPPGDVVNIAADLVYRAFNDPGTTRQRSIGQYSETRETGGAALELDADHRRRLNRYRMKRTSIPVESANPWWTVPLARQQSTW